MSTIDQSDLQAIICVVQFARGDSLKPSADVESRNRDSSDELTQ